MYIRHWCQSNASDPDSGFCLGDLGNHGIIAWWLHFVHGLATPRHPNRPEEIKTWSSSRQFPIKKHDLSGKSSAHHLLQLFMSSTQRLRGMWTQRKLGRSNGHRLWSLALVLFLWIQQPKMRGFHLSSEGLNQPLKDQMAPDVRDFLQVATEENAITWWQLKNVQVDLVKRKRRHSKTDGEAEPRATQTERERDRWIDT